MHYLFSVLKGTVNVVALHLPLIHHKLLLSFIFLYMIYKKNKLFNVNNKHYSSDSRFILMYSKCINELLRFYFVEESIRVPPEQVKDKLQLSGTLF